MFAGQRAPGSGLLISAPPNAIESDRTRSGHRFREHQKDVVMRNWLFASVLLLVNATAASAQLSATAHQGNGQAMIHQLRIYEIFDRNKEAFHARFRDHAARIMQRHGFHIVAMWEARNEQRTEFVYLLQWPSEQAMREQWARFMADEEWSDIKKKASAVHGDLVGEIEDRVLHLTDYSQKPF
jgi:heme-degrading monooxygenase HmoA